MKLRERGALNRRFAAIVLLVAGPAPTAAVRIAPTVLAGRLDVHGPTPFPRASGRTVWDSVYTSDQATRGQTSYSQSCARCHQASLGGADESPALAGSGFLGAWNGHSLGELHERIRTTMPQDDPGTYGRQLIADVLAYMLKFNGFPAGAVELPMDTEALRQIRLEAARP